MFFKQEVVLRNIFIIETGNPNIEQNIQQKRKIEKGEIHSVAFITNHVLHRAVDSKNPKWFN